MDQITSIDATIKTLPAVFLVRMIQLKNHVMKGLKDHSAKKVSIITEKFIKFFLSIPCYSYLVFSWKVLLNEIN